MLYGLRIFILPLVALVLACVYDAGSTAGATQFPSRAPFINGGSSATVAADPVDYRYYRRQREYDNRRFYGRNSYFPPRRRGFSDYRFYGGNRYFLPPPYRQYWRYHSPYRYRDRW